jgi:hypothetical protein
MGGLKPALLRLRAHNVLKFDMFPARITHPVTESSPPEIVDGEQAMTGASRNIFGLQIPSDSPVFLTVLSFHVLAALIAVVTGIIAMLSKKRPGHHPRFGTFYYWSLGVVCLSATALAAMRWSEDAYLFFLGAIALLAATLGRAARRGQWRGWVPTHISGMGCSYTIMVIAFYMDNGRNLPVWKELPSVAYWLIPIAVAAPLIVRALARYRGLSVQN